MSINFIKKGNSGSETKNDEIKSLFNGTIANNQSKSFELEPNSIYLFVSMGEANGNVLSDALLSGYIFTNEDAITFSPMDENYGANFNFFTFTGLTLKIYVPSNRWQAVSITKITTNINKYIENGESITANGSKKYTCDKGYNNYLLVVKDSKFTVFYLFTSANTTSYTAKLLTYPKNTYTSLTNNILPFSYTINDGRNITITNKRNYSITAKLIHL